MSTPCDNSQKAFSIPTGAPTNRSVRGCQVSSYFDHHPSVKLNTTIQPSHNTGITILNPQVLLAKGTTTIDQRAIDPIRNMATVGPIPSINSTIPSTDIYSPQLNDYGRSFKPYTDIAAGQYMYYIDKELQNPYHGPNFVIPSSVDKVLTQDPMGAMKLSYERTPLQRPCVVERGYNGNCLSFIDDSMRAREYLMSKQMSKMHQQSWSSAWPIDN